MRQFINKIFFLVLFILPLTFFADDDYGFWGSSSGVKPSNDKTYISECGSCHFVFQAGLLPKRSWQKMMADLENHFGTDASLDKTDRNYILTYLEVNSADNAREYKRSRKMDSSISKYDTPIKITEVPYFKKEHREIPSRFIIQKEVRSLSNCTACHKSADKGIYSERAINIPNYGRWDD